MSDNARALPTSSFVAAAVLFMRLPPVEEKEPFFSLARSSYDVKMTSQMLLLHTKQTHGGSGGGQKQLL